MRAAPVAHRRRAIATRLLALVLALASPAGFAFAQAAQQARPNIVVFVADDLGWRDSGPYGNTAIGTPHIDALARSGLLVKRAFGTTPQCGPSRISILSGRYPHATRAEDLHTPLPASEPWRRRCWKSRAWNRPR